jgi:hypothetical protein
LIQDRGTLMEIYKVAQAEKLFTSKSMIERAGLFLVLNSGLLTFFGFTRGSVDAPFLYGVLAALALADVLWCLANERNRSYTRYCVDHLARMEELLIEDDGELDAPRIYFNMKGFASGESLRLFPKCGKRKETRLSCFASIVRIEVAFSWIAAAFALLCLALIAWVAVRGLPGMQ